MIVGEINLGLPFTEYAVLKECGPLFEDHALLNSKAPLAILKS